MTIDSFKFLPRIIATFYQQSDLAPELPIPWTPLPKAIEDCKFTLITSGGIYLKGNQEPFDIEREKREPAWGDPSYREIPFDIVQEDIAASHLHINTQDILEDVNILLPVHRFRELESEGLIGSLADHVYSFMGYQGFPPNSTAWRDRYGPEIAEKLRAQEVNCVLLTPA